MPHGGHQKGLWWVDLGWTSGAHQALIFPISQIVGEENKRVKAGESRQLKKAKAKIYVVEKQIRFFLYSQSAGGVQPFNILQQNYV